MRSREELEQLVREYTAEASAAESRVDRAERREKEIAQAVAALSERERSALSDLESATHPDGLYKTRQAGEVAMELSALRGGLAELEGYARETRREALLERDNARRLTSDAARKRDELEAR